MAKLGIALDLVTSGFRGHAIDLDQNGMITQCAYCRMVKNYEHPERWDWVPAWIQKCPTNTSHTVWRTCFSYYFNAPR